MADRGTSTHAVEPVGRRQVLARWCQRAGLLPALRSLRGLVFRGELRILAYHRVLESIEPPDFSFDVELISASAEAFRKQMTYVRRHFTPMRFDDVVDRMDRGRALPKNAVVITFDDGYDDNYRIAFPILRELGMTAMFFVSTGHIDSGKPYAFDWLVHMVSVSTAERLQVPELGLDWRQAAAIGDDWPDLPLLLRVAFACAPPGAHVEVLALAQHVTRAAAGAGAAREFCDLLLVAGGHYRRLLGEVGA